jgi:hypothetical protein
MTSDDTGQSYFQNIFNASGRIYETVIYSDLAHTTRTAYYLYTLNSDGTYNKILYYDNSDVLTGSIYFTNINGLMTQLDYWTGDGTGTHSQQLIVAYDGSNRLTTVNMKYDFGSGLVNAACYVWTYTGSDIQPSLMEMYNWDSGTSSWTLVGTLTFTLNGTGTRVDKWSMSSFSTASVTDTYNGSNFYDIVTSYSDAAWTAKTGYTTYTYY